MVLRIHFTSDDLTRITLPVHRGATLGEAVLSLQVLRRRDQPLRFGPWRQRLRERLPDEVAPLLRMLPAEGWLPDFLTPPHPSYPEELEALSGAPKRRIAEDLTRLGATHRLPDWTRPLAAGDPGALGMLRGSVEAYHAVAIAPYSQRVNALLDAERARLMQVMATDGTEAMLATLHPTIRWQAPVLELPLESDRDFHLNGRTLIVISRFFCGSRVRALLNDTDTPAIVYPLPYDPLRPDPLAADPPKSGRPNPLAALLGRTRASVLSALADSPGYSTSQLAHRLGISVASASEHAAVLREAGLIASFRNRQAVCHVPTDLAVQLLNAGPRPADPVPVPPVTTAIPDGRP
jgi:DNA-binding transcriptional ArsR family regulator